MSKKKKKGRKDKQRKSGVATSSKKGIDARLKSYWERGYYGEYVTLYLRHWEKASQLPEAQYWDAAVYNALLKALFEEQDFNLLNSLIGDLERAPELSEENRACLYIAQAANILVSGKADLKQMHNLPPDVPGPFKRLRDHLAGLSEKAKKSALQEYLDGNRTRARKGERGFALAAKLKKQLQKLEEQSFKPASLTSFTQFRKGFEELEELVRSDSKDRSADILRDAVLLVDTMRQMYKGPDQFSNERDLLNLLYRQGFKFNRHNIVQGLFKTLLEMGGRYHGRDWEQRLRLGIYKLMPEIMQGLPEPAQKQLSVQKLLAREPAKSLDSNLSADLKILMDQDVWSWRERIVLILSRLYHIAHISEELIEELMTSVLDKRRGERVAKDLQNLGRQCTEHLLELFRLHKQLGIGEHNLLEKSLQIWEKFIYFVPLPEDQKTWQELSEYIVRLPLSSSRYLFLLHKCAQDPTSSVKVLQESIYKAKAPLELNREDVEYAKDLLYSTDSVETFRSWRAYLKPDDLRAIAERLLSASYKDSLDDIGADQILALGPRWIEMSRKLMWELSKEVSPDFPYAGLLHLTLKTSEGFYPMPHNEQEARPFFEYHTPAADLYEMFFWMLSWPETSYSNTFFEKIIWKLVDYVSQYKLWAELADAISETRSKDLARRVWDIWNSNDLFDLLGDRQDFKEAQEILRPLAFRSKPKKPKKKGPKKKSLLDEVLEERRNKKKE